MKKIITLIAGSTIALSSYAWGDREQGALLGLIIGSVITQSQQQQQQQRVIVQPVPQTQQIVILPPAQQPVPIIGTIPPKTGTCLQHPVYDQHGRVIAYQLSCH